MSYDFTEEYRDKNKGWPASWIKLGCFNCDDESLNGISEAELEQAIAAGWTEIEYEQSYENSMLCEESYNALGFDHGKHRATFSVLDWWTHLGLCPDCAGDEE